MQESIVIDTKAAPKGISFIFYAVREFIDDLIAGYHASSYSLLAAFYEIKSRYKASYLGPFWISLSNIIFIGFISLLYSKIFNIDIVEYVPYLTAGYLLWLLFMGVLLEGSGTYTTLGGVLKDYNISPLTMYLRVYYRALYVFAHNIPLMFLAVIYFQGWVINLPLMLVGLSFALVGLFFLGLCFAILACRFRDIYYVLPSVFQVLILIMPILWKPDMLKGRKALLLDLNILYQLLELVRAPMLGIAVPFQYYINCAAFIAVLFVVTAVSYTYTKRKIVFWS